MCVMVLKQIAIFKIRIYYACAQLCGRINVDPPPTRLLELVESHVSAYSTQFSCRVNSVFDPDILLTLVTLLRRQIPPQK